MKKVKNDFANFNSVKIEPFGKAPLGYVPGKGRGVTGFSGGVSRDDTSDDKDKNDYSDFNYDEFHGYSESLFKDTEYDEEDKEAEMIYNSIDDQMDIRRKSRRENKLKEEILKMRAQKPTIQEQFSDLKKGLADVTLEEWESIPTVLNYSRQKTKKIPTNYLPPPDSLIINKLNEANNNIINYTNDSNYTSNGLQTPVPIEGLQTPLRMGGLQTPLSGLRTPLGLQTPLSGLRTPLGLQTPLSGLRTPLYGNNMKNKMNNILSYGGLNTPFTLSGYMTPLTTSGINSTTGNSSSSGYSTPLLTNSNKLSLNDLGEARGTVLSVKLDELIDSVEGQTVIDPKGYLTNLNAKSCVSDTDVADINKARSLLKSVINTNPKHGPGWIAVARVEELAQRKDKAKEIIRRGCIECSKNEDIWLEAVRLEDNVNEAKIILTKAIKNIPTSVKLWLEAYKKEKNIDDKRKVLRKAIECIPNSVLLWKEAISLENEKNAYILLKRAVQCLSQCVEMWIALARLCDYTEAQKVLNEARKNIPTSAEIWINASKLEEKHKNFKMVDIIIKRCIENLTSKNVIFDRDKWIQFAEECEQTNFLLTCESIIKYTMNIGVEKLNKKRIYKEDAQNCIQNKSYHTARVIYNEALKIFKNKKSLWLDLANLELSQGNQTNLENVLHRAVKHCPHSSVLWLMLAKQKWLNNQIDEARNILAQSFIYNKNAEVISLAAVKLERENNEYDRARYLLKKSRIQCNTPKIWMQSVQLERLLKNYDQAKKLIYEALKIHKTFDKLYMIAGQIELEIAKANISNNSITIGDNSITIGDNSITIGDNSITINDNTATINDNTTTINDNTTTINDNTTTINDNTATINDNTTTINDNTTTIGDNTTTIGDNTTTISNNTTTINDNNAYKNAQRIYEEGLKFCPGSINLWVCAIDLQIMKKNYTLARALIEKAKIKIKNKYALNTTNNVLKNKAIIECNDNNLYEGDLVKTVNEVKNGNIMGSTNNKGTGTTTTTTTTTNTTNSSATTTTTTTPSSGSTKTNLQNNSSNNASIKVIENYDLLWLKLIEIEQMCNNKNINLILSEALKECPTSGLLWSKAIMLENKNIQNSKSVNAFNACGNNVYVVLTVALLFWTNFKIVKARKWFYRVITLNPSFGDGWATFLAFEIDQQNEINQKDIINKCIKAEPNRGYMWNKITKRVENWRLKYPQLLYKYIQEMFPHVLKKKISDKIMSIITNTDVNDGVIEKMAKNNDNNKSEKNEESEQSETNLTEDEYGKVHSLEKSQNSEEENIITKKKKKKEQQQQQQKQQEEDANSSENETNREHTLRNKNELNEISTITDENEATTKKTNKRKGNVTINGKSNKKKK
ncbi:pre-mRNA-processing factor 6, putative [Hepatocystis sp. ex Piliocolobus tephrosceles]|nr:pre-mRNA-processing factor 6, putative [Hepatocystis sp. ex Piliocolobus tephrosceles]